MSVNHILDPASAEYLELALKVSEASWVNDTLTIANIGLFAISREYTYELAGDRRSARVMNNLR